MLINMHVRESQRKLKQSSFIFFYVASLKEVEYINRAIFDMSENMSFVAIVIIVLLINSNETKGELTVRTMKKVNQRPWQTSLYICNKVRLYARDRFKCVSHAAYLDSMFKYNARDGTCNVCWPSASTTTDPMEVLNGPNFYKPGMLLEGQC